MFPRHPEASFKTFQSLGIHKFTSPDQAAEKGFRLGANGGEPPADLYALNGYLPMSLSAQSGKSVVMVFEQPLIPQYIFAGNYLAGYACRNGFQIGNFTPLGDRLSGRMLKMEDVFLNPSGLKAVISGLRRNRPQEIDLEEFKRNPNLLPQHLRNWSGYGFGFALAIYEDFDVRLGLHDVPVTQALYDLFIIGAAGEPIPPSWEATYPDDPFFQQLGHRGVYCGGLKVWLSTIGAKGVDPGNLADPDYLNYFKIGLADDDWKQQGALETGGVGSPRDRAKRSAYALGRLASSLRGNSG